MGDKRYVEVLPNGETAGRLPGSLEPDVLTQLNHPKSPIAAIRAKCLDCSGGSPSEVRKCTAFRCALWTMRMGVNPFYGKIHSSGEDGSDT